MGIPTSEEQIINMKYIILLAILPLAFAASIPEEEDTEVETQGGAYYHGCAWNCKFRKDGDYASCLGCDVYATCSNGQLIDNRPCPEGLVWNKRKGRCSSRSMCKPKMKRVVSCERNFLNRDNEDVEMRCPEGRVVQVEDAIYGRRSETMCQPAYPHLNSLECGDRERSTEIVSSMCNGKQSCSVAPKDRQFGYNWWSYNCFGTYKYLKAYYYCAFDY